MVAYTTLNVADHGTRAAPTLSNGNLTASNGGAEEACRAFDSHSSGKYYYEVHIDVEGGGQTNIAIVPNAAGNATLANPCLGSPGIAMINNGAIYTNAATSVTDGAFAAGSTVSVAVDVDHGEVWYRVNGGNWNGNALYDPALNLGGVAWAGMAAPVYPCYYGGSGATHTQTFNFGASAFTYGVPSGFTAGWIVGLPYDATQGMLMT
jgi:hypothetical protein